MERRFLKISALLTKTLQIKNSYQHYNTLVLLPLAALGYLRGETVAPSHEDASAAMKRGESRRVEEKREAAYFARAFPVFLGSHRAPARSPSPPSLARSLSVFPQAETESDFRPLGHGMHCPAAAAGWMERHPRGRGGRSIFWMRKTFTGDF